MNIVEPILYQARRQPETSALCAQGNDVVSYARLAAQMNAIARRAQSFGLGSASLDLQALDLQALAAQASLRCRSTNRCYMQRSFLD